MSTNRARRRMIASGLRRTLAYLLALQDGDDGVALTDSELRHVLDAHSHLRSAVVSLDPPPVFRRSPPEPA